MSNNPTPPRIEREAKEYAKMLHDDPLLKSTQFDHIRYASDDYKVGATAEHTRAAPVVKALEEMILNWEVGYKSECDAVDRINQTARSGTQYAKMAYPSIPDWVTNAKQILQTYKADV